MLRRRRPPAQRPGAGDREALLREVATVNWYHSIPLGNGLVTPGASQSRPLEPPAFPDVRGRSVLDVGAFDGYYSFKAEAEGAERVVALDHYMWGVNLDVRNQYWIACNERGVIPDRHRDTTDFWDPALPRRRGFDLAHRLLDSRVEPVVMDFMTGDVASLGRFDVVLFLGVLYHLTDPLGALERLRSVTAGVAVIETEAIAVPGHDGERLMRFIEGDELGGDHTNWFQISEAGLHGLCRAAGFARVDTLTGPPPPDAAEAGPLSTYRIVVHAHA